MPTMRDAIILLLDAGETTVAWARDALPPAEVDAVLGRPAADGGGDGGGGTGDGGGESDDGDGDGGGGQESAAAAESAGPPPNPRVFDVLRAAATRVVATRFCYFSKQDRLGAFFFFFPRVARAVSFSGFSL